jgi:hypothetical protein
LLKSFFAQDFFDQKIVLFRNKKITFFLFRKISIRKRKNPKNKKMKKPKKMGKNHREPEPEKTQKTPTQTFRKISKTGKNQNSHTKWASAHVVPLACVGGRIGFAA